MAGSVGVGEGSVAGSVGVGDVSAAGSVGVGDVYRYNVDYCIYNVGK